MLQGVTVGNHLNTSLVNVQLPCCGTCTDQEHSYCHRLSSSLPSLHSCTAIHVSVMPFSMTARHQLSCRRSQPTASQVHKTWVSALPLSTIHLSGQPNPALFMCTPSHRANREMAKPTGALLSLTTHAGAVPDNESQLATLAATETSTMPAIMFGHVCMQHTAHLLLRITCADRTGSQQQQPCMYTYTWSEAAAPTRVHAMSHCKATMQKREGQSLLWSSRVGSLSGQHTSCSHQQTASWQCVKNLGLVSPA